MEYSHASQANDFMNHIMAVTPLPDEQAGPEELPDKISAYFSLAFPSFTYYVQTVAVTIGRRSVRPGTPSSSDTQQVDVDLGPLKSVSRLHAKIEYEESQERFVLVVMGRNGAWVDGIWSGSGSRVPLAARSQIQIATRTFHFILPPPPAPEDSPSPSSPSSTTRHLSPSIDITSISPDSSIHSPTAANVELPSVDVTEKSPPEFSENGKASQKAIGKKRKKPGDARPPPPEIMPPRPQLTYAQLCYKAISSLNGKATLQEICIWVSESFDWYRYHEGTGWESSIRHNLSSNRAFKKMERCAGERGKGFFWSIDPRFEHLVKDQEGKGPGDAKGKGKKMLEPPLKRSVKGDLTSPLPPRLLSTSLPSTSSSLPPTTAATNSAPAHARSAVSNAASVKVEQETMSLMPPVDVPLHPKSEPVSAPSTRQQGGSPASSTARLNSTPNSNLPAIPSDIVIPIVIGSIPSAGPSDATSSKVPLALDLSSPPIALHRDTIILNPVIFSSLTPEQLKELERLGAKKAIEILQSYIVRFLKEKRKSEGSKSKGKKKNKVLKKKDGKDDTTTAASGADAGTASEGGQHRTTISIVEPMPTNPTTAKGASPAQALSPTSDMINAVGPLRISTPPTSSLGPQSSDEIDIMGDFDEPVMKRRRLDTGQVQA
ncbi:hypothetical protein DFH11DRAFT_1510596 [Phellopilus nigrolimitatus]|nr:hypothetical protein DFH11DRAFT_1510596 [Phellopilus nigrolimitatus]